MSTDFRELRKLSCPNCSAATILLWVHKNSPSAIPLCKICFVALRRKNRKESANYQVRYAPIIIHSDAEKWEVSPEKQYEFIELKRFISHCLDPQTRDSETNNFITKDQETLFQLVDLLFDFTGPILVPKSFEEYKKVNRPRIPPNIPKWKQKELIRDWEAKAKSRYKAYRYVFEKAHREQNALIELRRRIATGMRSDVQRRYGKPYYEGAKRVFWQILPPGRRPFVEVRNYFRKLQRDQGIRYDEERLKRIYSLGPSDIYIGTNEFKGYVAFYFEDLQIAVLDCDKFGNAIYAMDKDWQGLSQFGKETLRLNYPGKIERIPHRDDWFRRLKNFLSMNGWRPKE